MLIQRRIAKSGDSVETVDVRPTGSPQTPFFPGNSHLPRRRRIRRHGFWIAVTGVLATIAIYVIGLAWLQSRQHRLFEFHDLLKPRLVDVVIVTWLLWIGAAIGSFLNVVVWRMPRGESLNGRSHCPRCAAKLRARDNFPVFGWLALNGRCRSCRLPISPRYPIVEAVVGISIAAVGVAELYRLALPYQETIWQGGPLWAPIIDQPMLLILLYHVVMLSCSWACGLILYDGHRLPRALAVFSLAVAIVPMLLYPPLMVVPWQANTPLGWPQVEADQIGQLLNATLRILTALVAAVFFARLLSIRALPSADLKRDPLGRQSARLVDQIVIIALPAVVVGWQSIPVVLLFAMLIASALRWQFKDDDVNRRMAIAMPIAMAIQIAAWGKACQLDYWASVDSAPQVMIATAILMWFASIALVGAAEHTQEKQPDKDAGL